MAIDLMARVDDEHRAALERTPPDLLDLSDIPRARARYAEFVAALPVPPPPDGLQVRDVLVPAASGDAVRARVYVPAGVPPVAPAVLNIHGGGMVMGSIDADDVRCGVVADRIKVVVVSVDYRLAPEHPYPTPLEDCYTALTWLAANTAELGVDPGRIAVMGASAGGGLAAGLALLARDRGGPAICYQHLVFPMLDDRNATPSSREITDPRVWHHDANVAGWRAYLGPLRDRDVPVYAAPARGTNLSRLPPAYVCVGDLDLFLDEDIAYARALMRAGVPAELHVYPGAFHASTAFAPGATLSRRWIRDEFTSLARHLAPRDGGT